MAVLNKEEAKKILDKAIGFSKSDGISVSLNGAERGNIRYARNSVTTSGEDSNLVLGVNAFYGKKSGSSTVNEFDDASIEKAVRRAALRHGWQVAKEGPHRLGRADSRERQPLLHHGSHSQGRV